MTDANARAERPPIYSTRQPLAAFPWGEGPGQVPYERSDMGGLDDDAPAELLSLTPQRYWLRYPGSGRLVMLDLAARSSAVVDPAAALPPPWQGGIVYTYGMARTPEGGVAVVAGGRPAGEDGFTYALVRFDASGSSRGSLPLPELAAAEDTPEHLAVAPDGTLWVLGSSTAYLYDPRGTLMRVLVQTRGVLLPSGLFLAEGNPLRLLDMQGNPRGEVRLTASHGPEDLIVAGPGDLVVAGIDPESTRPGWEKHLQVFGLWRLSAAEPVLAPQGLIVTPALRLQVSEDNDLGDGMPIQSYFPPRGIAFTDQGDILMLEVTGEDCRLQVLRRLPDSADWAQRFARPVDLSRAELAVLRAEYLTRLGFAPGDHPFETLFQDMPWPRPSPRGPVSVAGTARDPILRALGAEHAARP